MRRYRGCRHQCRVCVRPRRVRLCSRGVPRVQPAVLRHGATQIPEDDLGKDGTQKYIYRHKSRTSMLRGISSRYQLACATQRHKEISGQLLCLPNNTGQDLLQSQIQKTFDSPTSSERPLKERVLLLCRTTICTTVMTLKAGGVVPVSNLSYICARHCRKSAVLPVELGCISRQQW